MSWNDSVQGLTQHFEQMTMRHAVNPMNMGSLLDEATAEAAQIQLNHDGQHGILLRSYLSGS